MNKTQIQTILAIVRPKIWAMYGKQKLKLVAYSMVKFKVRYEEFEYSGWFQVDGPEQSYKFRLTVNEIDTLSVGKLNI